ncbi:MAG: hypothetical protein FJ255_09355 [Phycisphaerae bacterium]|nr:hypothetical protein [Phycisphaerae bacterium]
MLLLNPRRVRFGSEAWEDVTAMVIDRRAARTVLEWSDEGPHAVLADVPRQRVGIRVVQQVAREDVSSPRPGDEALLVAYTSPAGSEGGRRRVSCFAVVVGVSHELSLSRGAVRTVELVAVSASGGADPIVVEDAGAQS